MGNSKSSRVSPGISALYAVVAFILEVGLLFAAGFAALAFLPWPPIVAVLVVLVPLLVLWSLVLSPKAKVSLRLRTRMVLIHLIYIVGTYVLWLSVTRTGEIPYQVWPGVMLGLTALSAILVIATRGYVVPHERDTKNSVGAAQPTIRPRSSGRRAAR